MNIKSTSRFFFVCALIFSTCFAHAFDLGLGVYRPEEKVQSSSGSEKADPISPNISIGHMWSFSWFDFAPRFGYIRHQNNSDDSYGKYQVETLYLLYNISTPLDGYGSGNLRVNYGLGTFGRKIKGEGGTVEIPNGSGTATAARPGEGKTSYTLSSQVGLDYRWGSSGSTVQGYGLQGYLFALQPLNNKKRMFALSLDFLVAF